MKELTPRQRVLDFIKKTPSKACTVADLKGASPDFTDKQASSALSHLKAAGALMTSGEKTNGYLRYELTELGETYKAREYSFRNSGSNKTKGKKAKSKKAKKKGSSVADNVDVVASFTDIASSMVAEINTLKERNKLIEESLLKCLQILREN